MHEENDPGKVSETFSRLVTFNEGIKTPLSWRGWAGVEFMDVQILEDFLKLHSMWMVLARQHSRSLPILSLASSHDLKCTIGQRSLEF